MPQLVTCPSCGFTTQMAEFLLGRRVRCPACSQGYVAEATQEPSAAPLSPPATPDLSRPDRPRTGRAEEDAPEDGVLPFCPGCGRRVRWDVLTCPHCGEELEEESHLARAFRHGPLEQSPLVLRRDGVPHRGKLINRLGNICLIFGGLSLCLAGLGALICLPLGLVTWMMAKGDLAQMRTGVMDPRGLQETEAGRTAALVGLVISLIFAAFYLLVYARLF